MTTGCFIEEKHFVCIHNLYIILYIYTSKNEDQYNLDRVDDHTEAHSSA